MGHKAKGVISGVGKGIMGVLTKPIGGAAELVSQTGYGELGEATSCSHGTLISLAPKPASPSLTDRVDRPVRIASSSPSTCLTGIVLQS